jgi:hypothetical protein
MTCHTDGCLLKDFDYSLSYRARFFRLETDQLSIAKFVPGKVVLCTPIDEPAEFEAQFPPPRRRRGAGPRDDSERAIAHRPVGLPALPHGFPGPAVLAIEDKDGPSEAESDMSVHSGDGRPDDDDDTRRVIPGIALDTSLEDEGDKALAADVLAMEHCDHAPDCDGIGDSAWDVFSTDSEKELLADDGEATPPLSSDVASPLAPVLPALIPAPPVPLVPIVRKMYMRGSGLPPPRFCLPNDEGHFKWEYNQENLNLHCTLLGHDDCVWNKTLKGSELVSRRSQGRAVGTQLAWWKAAKDDPIKYPDKASHNTLKRVVERCNPIYSFDIRRTLREWAKGLPALIRIFDTTDPLERPQWPEEAEEPASVAF